MPITLNGTTGITTPGLINTGSTTFVDLTTTGNTILGDQSTDTLNVANGNLVLNSSGNAGLGVTPSAWVAPIKALQINTTGALWANSSTIFLTNNTFTDGTDKYLTTAAATRYYQSAGSHIWNTAASGTAGNAVTFTQTMTLDASGNLLLGTTSLPSGGGIVTASSSAAETKVSIVNTGTSGRHYWLGSTNTSSGSLGGGKFAIFDQTANAARAVIDSSGNVGIGQTSPAYKLDIRNDVPASTSLDPTTIYMYNNSDGGSGIQFLNGVGGKSKISFGVESTGAGTDDTYIGFSTSVNGGALTERARITSGGYVGLGTASPATNLHIGSGTGNNLGVLLSRGVTTNFYEAYDGTKTFIGGVDNTLSYAKVGTLSAHDLAIITGNGSKIYCVNSTGNVGIGTSTPPMLLGLSVAGAVISGTATIGTNMQGIQVYNTTTATTNNAVGIWFPTGPHQAGIASFRADAATGWDTTLAFYTHGAATTGLTDCYERMRIDGEGNLLVGTTSSYTPYASIQVTGDNKGVAIRDSTDNSYRAIYNQSGTLYFWNGSNEGYLSSGGAWVNASDARLKSNIRNIEYGLSTVLATQPRHFERTDVEGTYIGFIAQELQLIIPEVVSGSEKQLGVDYGSLVALAFKAIQELKSELDSVKTELAALKGN